jgi:manganese/zinc/iron transport system permease protein
MINPYWGKDIWEFFALLWTRLSQGLSGELGISQLASDEIQILTLMALAIASSFVGAFLVLKRMSMLANSLSHTILLGIVVAYLLTFSTMQEGHGIDIKILLIGSLITALLTTLLSQLLTQVMKLQEDASIGLIFSTLFALGVLLVTLYTRSLHLGTEAVMGNVDALHFDDLKMSLFACLLNVVPISLFFKEFKTMSFDPSFAKSAGFSPSLFNYFLMVLLASTAIAAFRAVGVFLFLLLLVGPIIIARLFTHSLRSLIALALCIGSGCSLLAVALSRHVLSVYEIPLSTAGLLAALITLCYFGSLVIKKVWRDNFNGDNVFDISRETK